MTYLLDTNAFSDLMREHPGVDARLAGLGEADTVVLCPVVRGEIPYGLGRLAPGQRRQELETKAVALFARVPGEPIRESVGATLVSRDTDFRQIAGLNVEDWTA